MIVESAESINQEPSTFSTSKETKGIEMRVKGYNEVMHEEVDKSWFLKKYICLYIDL